MVAGDLNPILNKVVNSPAPWLTDAEKVYLPEVDIFAISYSTLNSAAPVGCRAEVAILAAYEGVVVLTPRDLRPTEARTDFEGLRGWDR